LMQFQERTDDCNRRSNLLAAAFADRLTDLVFPAADRAARLTSLMVREKPSPEAEKYLEEACLCYFYELYSASAIMCRSVLEEAIEKRFSRLNMKAVKESKAPGCTLGDLLKFAELPEQRNKNAIPPEAWRESWDVNILANKAVHETPLSEEEAPTCLTAARHSLICLLN